jgi:hypothetical protein
MVLNSTKKTILAVIIIFGYIALIAGLYSFQAPMPIIVVLVGAGFFILYLVDRESKPDESQKWKRPQDDSPPYLREPIPKSVKQYVWQRDRGRCVECGSNEKLEYDHIIPLVEGGSNTDRNIQLLCEKCNRKKGRKIM